MCLPNSTFWNRKLHNYPICKLWQCTKMNSTPSRRLSAWSVELYSCVYFSSGVLCVLSQMIFLSAVSIREILYICKFFLHLPTFFTHIFFAEDLWSLLRLLPGGPSTSPVPWNWCYLPSLCSKLSAAMLWNVKWLKCQESRKLWPCGCKQSASRPASYDLTMWGTPTQHSRSIYLHLFMYICVSIYLFI